MTIPALLGIATYYAGIYVGNPLYCSTPAAPLYYEASTAPWVALPYREYNVTWACGEPVYLEGVDATGKHWTLFARAWDTGPFGAYCVRQPDGTCPPIVVDVPKHLAPFAGMSSRVTVRNMAREAERMGVVP